MSLQVMAVQVMLVGWVFATNVILPARAQLKPNCPAYCGNVSIPYPFGTEDGCFLNERFRITCNHSFDPPIAFLMQGNIKVADIKIQGQLEVMLLKARDCYYKSGMRDRRTIATANLARFNISNIHNKFTVIGCDTYGYLEGNIGNKNYSSGCISFCDRIEDVDKSCSGTGCCQIEIPVGLNDITIKAYSFNNHTNVSDFNLCSYAFITEQSKLNFSSDYVRNIPIEKEFPVLIDWVIGEETCEEAKKNTSSYACKENSSCVSDNGTVGYRCKCLNGYEGNPYLGCQDTDECKTGQHKCLSEKNCINSVGNYTCFCQKGSHGDGRKSCDLDKKERPLIQIAVGIGVSIIVLVVVGSRAYLIYKKRKHLEQKDKFFRQNGGYMLQQQLHGRQISTDMAKIYSAEELEDATNNYDESRIIGRGGYGTVYKGYLKDDSAVAIKKSKIVDSSQLEQFINEVVVLSQINHRNVVKLLGCCLETEIPLLVYEFVNNGTLFDHIHDKSKAAAISWETRLRIAAETAGVLSYLHSAASTPIIHRDVKPTNILLDRNYTAKVSDFGASRLVPIDQTELSTMVQGTIGYLDPEYLHTSQLTEKSDVYSFGVVLVELLTGRKALSFDRPEEERNLARYFVSWLKCDQLFEILDEGVVKDGVSEQIKEVAEVAKRCLSVKGEERPTMKEVAMELDGLRVNEKHPWVGIEVNAEERETEYLLGESSDANFGDGDYTVNINSGYDSVRNQVLSPIDSGR